MSIPLGQPDRSSVLLKWSWLGLIIGEGRTRSLEELADQESAGYHCLLPECGRSTP